MWEFLLIIPIGIVLVFFIMVMTYIAVNNPIDKKEDYSYMWKIYKLKK